MSAAADIATRPLLALVDDDAAVGDALKFQLEMEGYDVAIYVDAASVLAAGLPNRPGCLVIDLNLPEMDGLALLQRLREQGVTLPAVLITSHPTANTRALAAAAAIPIVEKPLMRNELSDAVARAVQTAGSA